MPAPDPGLPSRPAPGSVELLRERLQDHGAGVALVGAREAGEAIAAACARHGAARLAVPADLPAGWLPAGIEAVAGASATVDELDAVDGALTGCVWALAETGTIVLDGGPAQGRRVLSLIPDLHVCVVRTSQVLADVPDLFAALEGEAARRPITLVSGPSATSDIELSRVEGVHGPRRFEAILVTP